MQAHQWLNANKDEDFIESILRWTREDADGRYAVEIGKLVRLWGWDDPNRVARVNPAQPDHVIIDYQWSKFQDTGIPCPPMMEHYSARHNDIEVWIFEDRVIAKGDTSACRSCKNFVRCQLDSPARSRGFQLAENPS